METKLLHKENDESPHFVLLSAHDSTILTLFAALDVTDYGEYRKVLIQSLIFFLTRYSSLCISCFL